MTRYRVQHPAWSIMGRAGLVIAIAGSFLGGESARAQGSLPIVDEVSFIVLRENCQRLRKALETLQSPLPDEIDKQLLPLLHASAADQNVAAEKIQKLLDARCLIGVSINPESRVKAARGPLAAELLLDRPVFALVKVQNDAGVTAALRIQGPELRTAETRGEGRWLEAVVLSAAPLSKTLSGAKVEYVILRLTARESGKREATLGFDVGQGTQDLGFRAEVPVLFTVRVAEK